MGVYLWKGIFLSSWKPVAWPVSLVVCTHVSCLTFRSGKRNTRQRGRERDKKTPTYATWHSLEGDKVRQNTLANRQRGKRRETKTGIESHPHPLLDISSMMFHLIKTASIHSTSVDVGGGLLKTLAWGTFLNFPERLVKASSNGEKETLASQQSLWSIALFTQQKSQIASQKNNC